MQLQIPRTKSLRIINVLKFLSSVFPDEMHDEMLCQCYGSDEYQTKFGTKRRPARRSNDATRGDYSELIETLCRVAAQIDYYIPPPEISYEQD